MGLSRCLRARIVMVHNDPSSLVRFSNISEDFSHSNCGVPLKIDLLKRKKLANFCFEVLLLRTTFVGFGSSSRPTRSNAVSISLHQSTWVNEPPIQLTCAHAIANVWWYDDVMPKDDSKSFAFERAFTTIEFIKPAFHSGIGWSIIAIQRLGGLWALIVSEISAFILAIFWSLWAVCRR